MWTNRLWKEIDRLFESTAPTPPASSASAPSYPPIAVWEDEESLHVEAEVAGLSRDKLELHVRGKELTISGERRITRPEKAPLHVNERGEGRFSRIIRLPVAIDTEKVEASYENGVLHLRLPKPAALRSRRIKVQGETEPPAVTEKPSEGTEKGE